MEMENKFRDLLKGKLLPAVLSIVLGIVIIIARRAALDLLVKIVGGLILAGGAVAPAAEETERNPRARSAKLRVAEKRETEA